MASAENRSGLVVTAHDREDMTWTFAYNRDKQLRNYISALKSSGYKPKLSYSKGNFIFSALAGYPNGTTQPH